METKSKFFQIKIEDPAKIFNLISRAVGEANDFMIGHVPLIKPAESLDMSVACDGKEYTLIAEILTADKPLIKLKNYKFKIGKPPLVIPSQLISAAYKTKTVGNAVFILDNQNQEQILIETVSDPAGINIELGGVSTVSVKITNLENFCQDLNQFVGVVELIINSFYPAGNQTADQIICYLKPNMWANYYPEGMDSDETETKPLNLLIENPHISFDQVGGNRIAKNEIRNLSMALKDRSRYQRWGTRPPKGVLMHGPPGTGKTLLAMALASEVNAKFLSVNVTTIGSKWYGVSEQLTANIFKTAKEAAPCVIFLDEIDAIASNRDNSHEATARVISVILTNMDGLNANENVLVLAATNRLEAVDEAIRRPGRFDRIIEVPLPDDHAREEIVRIKIAEAEKIAERKLFDEIFWLKLIHSTKGMSGADLAEIIRRTLENRVHLESTDTGLVSYNELADQIKIFEHIKKNSKPIGFSS